MARSRNKSERFVNLLISILLSFVSGWLFMLAVGVIHHGWIPACPTIGYWWSVLLASLIRGALYSYDADRDGDR